MPPLLLAHVFATFAMTGVIWMVQVVHYPLFAQVGSEAFASYHEAHTRLITWIVLPLMCMEAGTAALFAVQPPRPLAGWAAWLGLALVSLIWAVTFFHSIPRHGLLAGAFDPRAHTELVAGNWLRTLSWTLRSGLMLWCLSRPPVS
ncbi:MAG: hypothetical protein AAGD10_08600 [Myxococcota bacterium]